jgi:DNA invertase Pin-like site-specific DNA recombinase
MVKSTHIDDAGLDAKRSTAIEAIRRWIALGEIDIVMVSSLSDIGAGLDDLIGFMMELRTAGVGLYSQQDSIGSNTLSTETFYDLMAMLASYRNALRQERTRVGRQRAKAAGVRFGRPPVSEAKLLAVRLNLQTGAGIRPTSRMTGVSPAKVLMVQRQMTAGELPVETGAP